MGVSPMSRGMPLSLQSKCHWRIQHMGETPMPRKTSCMLFGRPLSVAIGLLLLATTARGEPGVSLASLLEEMIDVDAVARWPEPAYTCRQASSYDRHRAGPDKPGWF